MGKKKTKKVFKVAGAKSLKAKGKPAQVKGQLKKDIVKNKSKIDELNKQYKLLQNKKRESSSKHKKEIKHTDLSSVNPKKSQDKVEMPNFEAMQL